MAIRTLSNPVPSSGPDAMDSEKSQQTFLRNELKVDAPSAATESAPEDDALLYGDQDDARTFMQPALSPMATRLTSPRTPAAEKAAAMERELDSFFDPFPGRDAEGSGGIQPTISSVLLAPASQPPSSSPPRVADVLDKGKDSEPSEPGAGVEATVPFPQLPQLPWQQHKPSPLIPSSFLPQSPQQQQRQQQQQPDSTKQSALAGVFGEGRHRRSSSVGTDALKRLSKALPSLSLPTGLFPNISTSSFFSSTSFLSTTPSPQKAAFTSSHSGVASPSTPSSSIRRTQPNIRRVEAASASPRPPSIISIRESHTLRRSTSADSLLYTTLSRVSSLGDDDRFGGIRDQVNSRFKAIVDSFDRPSFKMPQLPNIISTPLKKNSATASVEDSNVYVRTRAAPTANAKAAASPPKDGAAMMDAVLETLTGDIVIMGGYRGSVLRSAEPPHRQLWVPVKVGLGIRKVNLEIGLDPEDEETMHERIFASGMLQNIGPVDISRRLFRKLRESPNARSGKLRVHDFAWDWRLSPARSSRQLITFLEGLPCNKQGNGSGGAMVLAHSLGGLVTRHAVNQRPELFAGVVYVGVPQRCISILGPLRSGDAVLLNEKVLSAQVNFSFRSSFALLPEDGFCFLSKDMKETYPVDFFDPEAWVRYKLSPCTEPNAPLAQQPPSASAAINGSSSGGGGGASKRSSTILRDLSSSFPSLPLRGRSGSDAKGFGGGGGGGGGGKAGESSASGGAASSKSNANKPLAARSRSRSKSKSRSQSRQRSSSSRRSSPDSHTPASSSPASPPLTSPPDSQGVTSSNNSSSSSSRVLAYLTRTLAETKQFRAETQHVPALSEANAYPPVAVIYGKDTPTVYGARVAGRDAISTAEAYDDLVFRSGDGVVLAREAMLPAGYDVVRGGRISTEKGHISMLGDFGAVARAIEAVRRGRRKGIGLGVGAVAGKMTSAAATMTTTSGTAAAAAGRLQ